MTAQNTPISMGVERHLRQAVGELVNRRRGNQNHGKHQNGADGFECNHHGQCDQGQGGKNLASGDARGCRHFRSKCDEVQFF